MPRYDFVTLDVFTDTPFGGNPLAVFPDARGLDGAQMQKIAREFNYSETTFVLPPRDPAHTAQVRIFTPATELPFAGHPNIGTAHALALAGEAFGRRLGDTLVFEEAAGLVPISVFRDAGGGVAATELSAPRPLAIEGEVTAADAAACAGLAVSAVRTGAHVPLIASVGVPFVFAELDSLDALAAARPDSAAFRAASARHPGYESHFALFVYVRTGGSASAPTLRARMFAPLGDMPEDPATGSAAAALGALFAHLAPGADAALSLSITQGVEMGRPSRIAVTAGKTAGTVGAVKVRGGSVPMLAGALTLG